MNTSKELHREAMKIAQEANLSEINNRDTDALLLYMKAFELEKKAAFQYIDKDIEPTRSVLFRSAASLAKSAGKYTDAVDLLDKALAGNPPDEIIVECETLYNQISREISILLIKELTSIKSEIKQELKSIHDILNFLLLDKFAINQQSDNEMTNINNLYSKYSKPAKQKNIIGIGSPIYPTDNSLVTYSN